MAMTPSKPYILRAIYDWIVDNGCTPYLLVDAMRDGVEVPQQYVKDGQIVLNVAPSAVVELRLGNDEIRFRGRFGGVPTDIVAPVGSILGIYAKENGQGMVFDPEEFPEPDPNGGREPASSGRRPSLKVVK